MRNGRIDALFSGASPDPKRLRAEVIEGSGKTLLPGLIDARVDLSRSGAPSTRRDFRGSVERALAAHLYCGVTTVGSAPEAAVPIEKALARIRTGERLGAEVQMPSPGGAPGAAAFSPLLGLREARWNASRRDAGLLDRSLVLQVTPGPDVATVRRALLAGNLVPRQDLDEDPAIALEAARESLRRAYRAGTLLVMATDSGSPLVFHGPALHRELQLWVEAGIPAGISLQAATSNAARFLQLAGRTGLIQRGKDADLLLIDGNPLQDISVTERISGVILKGERIARSGLFDQE